ncbi:MAG: hypothetical protein HY896_03850 [Deltaproteobacteria bacterium]|nr:hypothetical protein [Deltaproteobacteria bacterium]
METSASETSCPSPSSASLDTEEKSHRGVIHAVFLLSAAALADEIFLIRLLSIRFWPHFVPMIVSQAMLGFGAAGVALHLLRERIEKYPRRVFAWLIILAAPSFDLAFRASQRIAFDPFLLLWEPGAWPAFGLFFILLAVPFFLAGGAIAVPFSFRMGRPGPVYAASFAGSAAGAVIALAVFPLVRTESLLRIPLALCLAAGLLFLREPRRGGRWGRRAAWGFSLLLLLLPPAELSPSPYKDLAVARKLPGARQLAARYGPSGDYRAVYAPGIHVAPGLSFRFAGDIPPQAVVFCDGEARGIVPAEGSIRYPAYLDYFPSSLAYRLVTRPAVLQFGLRGTEGILAAAGNGASSITVVEPAGELASLLRNDLAAFSGGWPAPAGTEIRTEGARNFLARNSGRFDLIEAAEISSPSFTSLGIHATGETFLLTREGVRSALSRLSDRGLLSFSGWLKSPPRESVKILATVRLELERSGAAPASDRIIIARGWGTFVVLARRTPFTEEDLLRARRFCEERGFSMVWPAGRGSVSGGEEERALQAAVKRTMEGYSGDRSADFFDLSPVTDDSPYFYRLLKPGKLPEFRRILGSQWIPFAEWGVVFLLLSLAVSLALAAVCLLAPLGFSRFRESAGGAPFAAYFSALGLAYMLIELTWLKIGILILGDSIRAATAAIGGFAFFSGLGSAASGRWDAPRTMSRRVFPAIAVFTLSGYTFLSLSADNLLSSGEALRTIAFLASLAPAALLMGAPFPAAMSRLSVSAPSSIPFAWGINGFFSVAGASLASVGAMWMGFRGTVIAGAALYLAAGALYPRVGIRKGGE